MSLTLEVEFPDGTTGEYWKITQITFERHCYTDEFYKPTVKVECWPDSTVYGNQTIMTPIIDSKMVCTYEEPDIDPTAILAANGDILSLVEGHTKDGYHLVEDEPTLFLFNSFFETAT